MKTAYKFLRTGMKSDYDGSVWKLGEWRKVNPPCEPCVGLNASRNIVDALGYIQGEILAKVEYKGGVIDSGDKLTCEKMRIVRTWKWTKEHSVRLAVYAARQVLSIYEEEYPGDDRPRRAIEAAEAYLKDPSNKTVRAARAAVWAAAGAAAYTAVHAAGAAARAAVHTADAAYTAVHAADAAARGARAAYAAGGNKIKNKAHRYVLRMLKEDRR